ncbi:OmpA family protein [Raineya sp.]|jgi:outer membrane protein OmpA-like peptidoglycan-associated protein
MKVVRIFLLVLLTVAFGMSVNAQKAKPKKGVQPRKVNVPAVYRVDSDNDGVPDVRDQCPNTPKEMEIEKDGKKNKVKIEVDDYGCPKDTDKDGVYDYEDKCPGTPGDAQANMGTMGPRENNGCPWGDKDGDGFLDNEDKCPDVPGVARYFGCPAPDFDGDGVPDEEDDCKDKKGPKHNRGCPEMKDSDGDGLMDYEDGCPDKPGPRETKGCPKIVSAAEEAILKQASKIEFESGKATINEKLQKKWYPILDKVVDILKSKPETFMLIEGHTDNVTPQKSSFKDNKALSEARAKFVMDYMISKGISATRLKAVGYGDTKPFEIDSPDAKPLSKPEEIAEYNKTKQQKEMNRRVKMTISSVKLW